MMQNHQGFFLFTVIVYPLTGLLVLLIWWSAVRQHTKTPRPACYLLALALWLIFSSFVLYVLQFVFPLLTVYVLYVLFGMIFLSLLARFSIEKNDFLHPASLAMSIINGIILGIYTPVDLRSVISTILLTLTSLNASFVGILSFVAPFAWYLLTGLALWMYGKKQRWDLAPLWWRAGSSPSGRH